MVAMEQVSDFCVIPFRRQLDSEIGRGNHVENPPLANENPDGGEQGDGPRGEEHLWGVWRKSHGWGIGGVVSVVVGCAAGVGCGAGKGAGWSMANLGSKSCMPAKNTRR